MISSKWKDIISKPSLRLRCGPYKQSRPVRRLDSQIGREVGASHTEPELRVEEVTSETGKRMILRISKNRTTAVVLTLLFLNWEINIPIKCCTNSECLALNSVVSLILPAN